MTYIKLKLQESVCSAKNKILIIDACHSGAGRDVAAAVRMSFTLLEEVENSTSGFVCITSCSGGQLSYELSELNQGIFSYYLASGISGEADPLGKGIIDVESLYRFVQKRTVNHAKSIGVEQEPHLIAKVSASLNTFTISSAPLESPINQVLILSKDPMLGKLLETGISMNKLVRKATWISDLKTLTNEVKNKFDYDAVYVDVGIGDDWEIKRDFILAIRDLYSVIPFVLVGHRKIFLQRLTEKESKKFQGYFFFDIGISISQIPTLIQDTLTQVEWDIRARYGVKAV